jgi:hypothetical protein
MSTIERDAGATTEPSSHWTVTAKALLATEPAGRVLALAKMEPRVRAAIAAEVCRLEPLKQPSSGAPR